MMQEHNAQIKGRGRRKRRAENITLFASIILCLITLSAVTVCMVMFFKYRATQQENIEVMSELEALQNTFTQEEVDYLLAQKEEEVGLAVSEDTRQEILDEMKELMLSGDGTLKMLRHFYPEDIVLVDSNQYYFFPILDTLKQHTYLQENLTLTEDGLMEYYEDETIVSHKGIDVSRYQEKIDWEEVAKDGVEYAFIRLGVRGYTEGEIVEDAMFETNIKGALKNDIAAGIYFFTQATSVEEAEEEAKYVLDAIEPYQITYPVVIDVEAVSAQNARTADLTKEERTEYCITFCEMIRAAGYTPMIYGNLKTFMLMLDIEQLEDYDKWLASYDTNLYFPYEFKIWQYTDSGEVEGIRADVDMNISFLEFGD
ncbi:MAG: glycoside hydrolase family 25 protein [Blautia sp.]|nr:glycoside hydrolase family 25 protein [Lachnoclostridium sp.]MCM1210620.1 glycoside hydrolase family 25 protein [Blautia sp.]